MIIPFIVLIIIIMLLLSNVLNWEEKNNIKFWLTNLKQKGVWQIKINDSDVELKGEDYEQQPYGDRSKDILNLNQFEVDILNKLIDTNNYFNSHVLVTRELIRLFLNTIEDVYLFYKEQGTTFSLQIELFRKKILGSNIQLNTYELSKLANISELVFQCIFKTCEKTLRIQFQVDHGLIKLSNYLPKEIIGEYNDFFGITVSVIIEKNLNKTIKLSIEDEVFFNNYGGRKRYERQLNEIEDSFIRDNLNDYVNKVLFLEKSNLDNPKIKNIFFRSANFIADYHSETAVMFYLYYIYYDLVSTNFQFKQLSSETIKKLFPKSKQQEIFGEIINQLFADNDLNKAIDNISVIFAPEPNRVVLEKDSIKIIFKNHLKTVELLNKLLSDEKEETKTKVLVQHLKKHSIRENTTTILGQATESAGANTFGMSPIQIEVLKLFSENGFSLSHKTIEEFAKENSLFVNQFLNSINEDLYDVIDDILIEEQDGYYFLNKSYYSKLFNS